MIKKTGYLFTRDATRCKGEARFKTSLNCYNS